MKAKIELLSDLCTSAGDGQASIVDTEVCFDDFGLPFIPAKRLKGLLKESLIEVLEAKGLLDSEILVIVEALFNQGGITISNAYIEDYEVIKKEIKTLKTFGKEDYCKSLLGKYQVLSVFTSLRSQTAIDWDGVAKEKSLRTTRVINKGTSFVFPIGLADSSMDCHVKDALKGIRHIGLNRTRGFGHVRILPLEETTLTKPEEKVVMNGEVVKTLDETGYVQIRYKLVDDVIISNSAIPGNETLDYIPGSMVLGAMASQYLRKEKLAHTDAHRDPFFSKIFIHGNIVFSNAYIADPEGIRAIPTPSMLYYNKTKPESTELKVEKDNEFKVPLGGYCCIHENSQIEKCGISKIINYHHRRPANKSYGHALKEGQSVEETGTLFTYEALKRDQEFVGYLKGNPEDLKRLMECIADDSILRIGRSRSAQYSTVQIVYESFPEENLEIRDAEDNIYMVLASDLILPVFGSSDSKLLLDTLESEMNKTYPRLKIDRQNTVFRTSSYSGFNTKWGLPKTSAVTLKAGSTFKLIIDSGFEYSLFSDEHLGLKTGEGYGEVIFVSLNNPRIIKIDIKKSLGGSYKPSEATKRILECIQKKLFLEKMRSEARKKAIQDAKRCEINNRTTAGKLRNILEGSYINGRFDCLLYFTKQLKMIKKSGKGKEFVDYLEESGILEKVKRNILSATNAKWQTSFKDETINEPSFKNCYQYEFLKAFIYTRMLELGEKEEKD